MDLFHRLVQAAAMRQQDTPLETRVLDAMRRIPRREGTLGELSRLLPDIQQQRLYHLVMNLVVRGKVDITRERKWRLPQDPPPAKTRGT